MLYHIKYFLDESFIRIHRSYCVNKKWVVGFDYPKYPEALVLIDGQELAISRRKKRECVISPQGI
jgi:DNA-binding LytR/AlgR family response regulator